MTPRVCLIGCGSIAWAAHGPALKQLQREAKVQLAGCCDMDADRAKRFAESFDFSGPYSQAERMLAEQKPDITFCLLPVKLNAEMAVKVMHSGSSSIMEKPPGLNHEESQMILDTAEETGMACGVMFNRRFMPIVQKLKALIAGKKIDAVCLEMARFNRRNEDFTTTMVHGVDCLHYLFGDYESLDFQYQQMPDYVNFFVNGWMKDNIHVQMQFLPCAGAVTERIHVYGEGVHYYAELPVWDGILYTPGFDHPGRIVIAESGKEPVCIAGDSLMQESLGFVLNGFYNEDDAAISGLCSELGAAFSIRTALQSVEICEKMRQRNTEYRKGESV